ncbi:unnamed protein product [Didymodactylos carnosus]|uniref:Serine aminopeptidase S33 domain-containing protein n=1 Tax=Didymodactylos carnosus TaxID=1234261 RepID=A0A813XMB6_9BILA|nr:unnamed protein product [Didymodactylos carnosus]CAF1069197.1 unnamed protein product [Didymodactylos carnosus]CAF3654597.1 unnamed protein product [Didymodactylos carnosus]CAF3833794.1 unnamed protein product [Didymodactylos carnosus]
MASSTTSATLNSSSTQVFFTFLHGFTSDSSVGGGGKIANFIAQMFKVDIEQPDLNQPSFNEFSVSNALKVIDQLYVKKKKELCSTSNTQLKMNLVGASMGGYIAARWAQLNPDKVNKLFLLCPAFNLAARWQEFLTQEEMEKWRKSGKHSYDGRQLHYEFFEDAHKNHPLYPEVNCPTSIIHGTKDQIIPIVSSRKFLELHKDKKNVVLHEVIDDHYLTQSVMQIIPVNSRRIAAAEAAEQRLQQMETRGVDIEQLRRQQQKKVEMERMEQKRNPLGAEGYGAGGLKCVSRPQWPYELQIPVNSSKIHRIDPLRLSNRSLIYKHTPVGYIINYIKI